MSADEIQGFDWQPDVFYMESALRCAQRAAKADEVPIGAVIVRNGEIIGRAWNQVEMLRDATAHAEMLAITQAEAAVGDWRLNECDLYVTKEPCPMCAGAIVQARIPVVVYGASDPKAGAVRSLFRLLDDPRLNHRAEIIPDVLADPCGAILTRFFDQQRRLGKK